MFNKKDIPWLENCPPEAENNSKGTNWIDTNMIEGWQSVMGETAERERWRRSEQKAKKGNHLLKEDNELWPGAGGSSHQERNQIQGDLPH